MLWGWNTTSDGTETIDQDERDIEITALFSDIADFTALVESLETSILRTVLKEYLSGMADVVFKHDGTIAKILGDKMHMLFGVTDIQPDHASRAIACALALDEYAQHFRRRWQQRHVSVGITRIGGHAGRAVFGNFGGDRFFECCAYGDTINVASRLESANKQIGTRILVSAALAAKANSFAGRPVGDLVLRGRSEPIRAFEPFQFDQPKDLQMAKNYRKAFALLEAADPRAVAAFAAHVGKYPADRLASFHLKRLLAGECGIRIALT
jgi:adenylate cyclase